MGNGTGPTSYSLSTGTLTAASETIGMSLGTFASPRTAERTP